MGFPVDRPRRLRRTAALRRLVAETRIAPADLILPLFVKEGLTEPVPVDSMPGVVQHSRQSLRKAAHEAAVAGVGGVMLFGIPEHKDDKGLQADAEDGVVQCSLRDLKSDLGQDVVLVADLCLCEYTDHGHCGPLAGSGIVDNDATIVRYGSVAVAQVRAGADVVAPSGMMDGQVGAIRSALDECGFADHAILAYAAKYASAFYGPFRDAAESTPSHGDRRGYQMDPANGDEAVREVLADLEQGADWVMVKPAGPYLDVIRRVRETVDAPRRIERATKPHYIERRRAYLQPDGTIRYRYSRNQDSSAGNVYDGPSLPVDPNDPSPVVTEYKHVKVPGQPITETVIVVRQGDRVLSVTPRTPLRYHTMDFGNLSDYEN